MLSVLSGQSPRNDREIDLETKAAWVADYPDNEDMSPFFMWVEETILLDGMATIESSEYVEGDYSNSVTGQITNMSGLPLEYLKVAAKYYNVVGNGIDNVTNLCAGEIYEFELYVSSELVASEYQLEWST